MLADFAGHLDMHKYLRSPGASSEAKNLADHTASPQAASRGHSHVIEWMVDDGWSIGVSSIHVRASCTLYKKTLGCCNRSREGL